MIRLLSLEAADITSLVDQESASTAHPWSEQNLREAVRSERVDCRTLTGKGGVIGYLVIQRVLDEAELQNLVVFRDWQAQGWGYQALNALFQTLAEQGVRSVYLEVRESNRAARSLYLKTGFVESGVRKRYYRVGVQGREDAVLMSKDLGA